VITYHSQSDPECELFVYKVYLAASRPSTASQRTVLKVWTALEMSEFKLIISS